MSQAGGPSGGGGSPSEIGAISVGLRVDTASLGADFAAAKAKFDEAARGLAKSAVVPVGDKSASKTANESAKSFREATNEATLFTRSLGRITGAAFALVRVMDTLAIAVDYVKNTFGSGKKAADDFYASIGGASVGEDAARKNLEAIQQRLLQVNSELARIKDSAKGGMSMAIAGRSEETIKQEIASLLELNKVVGDQVRVFDKLKKLKDPSTNPDDFVGPSMLDSMMVLDANRAANAQEFDEAQRERDREAAEERSRLENEEHAERMARVEEIGNAATDIVDPTIGRARDFNAQIRELERARSVARTDAEKANIDRIAKLKADAEVKEIKARAREIGESIGGAINAALQQQAGAAGVQNTTVLMKDIGLQVGSIRNSIPREYSGPVQGVPGGMGGN